MYIYDVTKLNVRSDTFHIKIGWGCVEVLDHVAEIDWDAPIDHMVYVINDIEGVELN